MTKEQMGVDLSDMMYVEDIKSFVEMAQQFVNLNQFLLILTTLLIETTNARNKIK